MADDLALYQALPRLGEYASGTVCVYHDVRLACMTVVTLLCVWGGLLLQSKRGATHGTCPILAGTSSIRGRSPRFKTLATHFEAPPDGYA
jgi:hypothetical protein